MKQALGLVLAVAFTQALFCATGAEANDLDSIFQMSRSVVYGERAAYLMMPPNFVSAPFVEDVKWSPDGKYAAILRSTLRMDSRQIQALMKSQTSSEAAQTEPTDVGETELALYSRQGKLFSIWKGNMLLSRVNEYQWLAQDTLVALTTTTDNDKATTTPIVVRISQGKMTTSTLAQTDVTPEFSISPTKATAVLIWGDTPQARVVRTNGPDSIVALPGAQNVHSQAVWSANGSEPYLKVKDGDKISFFAFSGNELVPLTEKPTLYESKGALQKVNAPLELVTRDTPVKETGSEGVLKTLWLVAAGQKDKSAPGLVSGDVSKSELSPSGDAVLYVTMDGAAFVRGILPVDKKLMDEIHDQATRTALMSEAKQIGMGLIMFSDDHNDNLPDAAGLRDYLGPRGRDMLDRFHYTYAGQTLSGIANPTATVLGYTPGPGGKAVLYADGHVRWTPDSEPPANAR